MNGGWAKPIRYYKSQMIVKQARNTIDIEIFGVKNSAIEWFNGTGETALCSGSNLAHHPKMSPARVPIKILN
jgi:hypothetical protein